MKKTYDFDFLSKGGPYSHAVEGGGFLFLSGMLPLDSEKGAAVNDNIKKATELCLNNIRRALEKAGSRMDKVIKVTVFLRDISYFSEMNEVYRTFFRDSPPARTCVAVAGIPGNYPLEIDAIALK